MSARSRAFPWWGQRRPRPILDMASIERERERRALRAIEENPVYGYEILFDFNHARWP